MGVGVSTAACTTIGLQAESRKKKPKNNPVNRIRNFAPELMLNYTSPWYAWQSTAMRSAG
jgi:hypothetical protein